MTDSDPIVTNWGCDKHGNLLGYRVYDERRRKMRLIGADGHDRSVERDEVSGEVTAVIDLVTGDRLEPRQQPDAPKIIEFDDHGNVVIVAS